MSAGVRRDSPASGGGLGISPSSRFSRSPQTHVCVQTLERRPPMSEEEELQIALALSLSISRGGASEGGGSGGGDTQPAHVPRFGSRPPRPPRQGGIVRGADTELSYEALVELEDVRTVVPVR